MARLQCLLAVEVVGNKNPVGIAENNKRFRPPELSNVASARNSKTLRSDRWAMLAKPRGKRGRGGLAVCDQNGIQAGSGVTFWLTFAFGV